MGNRLRKHPLKVYVIPTLAEATGLCKCCGRKKELRFGYCYDCAEGESIVGDGVDMFDKKAPAEQINGLNSNAMQKLRYLILKGWTPPEKGD